MDLTAITETLDPTKGHELMVRTFISSGQPRAYADSQSVMEFRSFWYNSYNGTIRQDSGEGLLRTVERQFSDYARERGSDWATAFNTYLSSIALTDNETAVRVVLVTPYCD